MKTGPKGRVAHACFTEEYCVHLFTSGQVAHLSCTHRCPSTLNAPRGGGGGGGGGCSLSKRIGGLRIIRLLSTSQVVLFSYSYTVCHGGGDTVVVLSLYLGPLLLKYRILPGRDRFPRVNDTKIVCRPREGGGGGGEGGTHAEQSRAPTLFVTPSFTSRSNVEPNCSTREEFPANYDELRIRFSYSPIFISIDVGRRRKGKRGGQWYASLIYIYRRTYEF